jgi:nucleotide-binding universal stress UspA family protein
MRMTATIIAAMDDSPASLHAARLLAGYQGDRRRIAVVALNVQSRPLTLWPGPAVDPGKMDEALLAEGRRRIEPACTVLAEAGLKHERAVRLGIPAESIAEEALRRGAAAIVMGTRGHGALGGFALGSVALRVAHRAQAPVVLVRPDTVQPAALGERVRVLVPLDGSAHATRALNHLLGWRKWLGEVEIDLVHIRSAPTFLDDLLPADRSLLDQWGSQEAEQATREARALLYLAGIDSRLHEAAGEPSAEIVRLAGVLGSELVVMGTRGLGAVHHALIGSVALKVAHASAVPVALI